MNFMRRLMQYDHGSLVTGEGTWGDASAAPIKLEPLPSDLSKLVALLKQRPVASVHRFTTGGAAAASPGYVGWLAVGQIMSVVLKTVAAKAVHMPAQGHTLVVQRVGKDTFEAHIEITG